MIFFWMRLFAYSWKLPAYSGAFLLTVDNFSFSSYSWSFFAYSFSFFTYSWSFFAYNGKVRLIRAFRDCKQRSLTVSKKTPTVGRKTSPPSFWAVPFPPFRIRYNFGARSSGSSGSLGGKLTVSPQGSAASTKASSSSKQNKKIKGSSEFAIARSPYRAPKLLKVRFKTRKMPFWTPPPQQMAPQVN